MADLVEEARRLFAKMTSEYTEAVFLGDLDPDVTSLDDFVRTSYPDLWGLWQTAGLSGEKWWIDKEGEM